MKSELLDAIYVIGVTTKRADFFELYKKLKKEYTKEIENSKTKEQLQVILRKQK